MSTTPIPVKSTSKPIVRLVENLRQRADRRWFSVVAIMLLWVIVALASRFVVAFVQPSLGWEPVINFLRFLWIAFNHWQSLVTGGGIVALVTIYERFVAEISDRAFRRIFVIGFSGVAFFTAWQDAYLSMKGREADLRFANVQLNALRKLPQSPQFSFQSDDKLTDFES